MDLNRRYYETYGVWKYPFDAVLLRFNPESGKREWTIDLLEAPGGLVGELPIDAVQPGDAIASDLLVDEPMWIVEWVDPDTSRIFVQPAPTNPFASGVGAGGAVLTEHDFEVFSGEFETKRVNAILDRINAGEVQSYNDVAYLLLGTVPVRMGPNGAEGGWYLSRDTWSTRGAQQGLSPAEIQARDAATLQRIGLPVPPAALAGELPDDVWDNLVKTPSRNPFGRWNDPGPLFEGEDFEDPEAMVRMVATHPLSSVKDRNLEHLAEWARPRGPVIQLRDEVGDRYASLIDNARSAGDLEEVRMLVDLRASEYDTLDFAWRRGDFDEDPSRVEWLRKAITIAARLPVPAGAPFDPHYLVREHAINEAVYRLGDRSLLPLFEEAPDPETRALVARLYGERGMFEPLEKMVRVETHPQALRAILNGIWVAQSAGHALRALEHAPYTGPSNNPAESYEAEQLDAFVKQLRLAVEKETHGGGMTTGSLAVPHQAIVVPDPAAWRPPIVPSREEAEAAGLAVPEMTARGVIADAAYELSDGAYAVVAGSLLLELVTLLRSVSAELEPYAVRLSMPDTYPWHGPGTVPPWARRDHWYDTLDRALQEYETYAQELILDEKQSDDDLDLNQARETLEEIIREAYEDYQDSEADIPHALGWAQALVNAESLVVPPEFTWDKASDVWRYDWYRWLLDAIASAGFYLDEPDDWDAGLAAAQRRVEGAWLRSLARLNFQGGSAFTP